MFAALFSAIIGFGTSEYQRRRQEDAQTIARHEAEQAQREAEQEAERIALETRPDQELATIDFGTQRDTNTTRGFEQFLTPLQQSTTSGLGTTGSRTAGLGFA